MTTLIQAKERVCKSLLTKVSHLDDLLAESNLKTEKDKISKIYDHQGSLLYRLEKVVTH